MKVLIAPLNWGLGHASRCIPLIHQYLDQGNEVVLGGDGDTLVLLRQHFPSLRTIELASLDIRYSHTQSQIRAMWKALPKLARFAILDHHYLADLVTRESFDLIISDNRFGLFTRHVRCVYLTHQLHICLPKSLRWLEPLCTLLHAAFYRRYDEVWVPDNNKNGLSGKLGHPRYPLRKVKYIGLLSRFAYLNQSETDSDTERYEVVAVLSGPEPQRSMFEQEIVQRYLSHSEKVLIIRGKVQDTKTRIQHANITFLPYTDDTQLVSYLASATTIIARSGYSTIMDLATLGMLEKAELHPTPGQPEQEYLFDYLSSKLR